MKQKRTKPPPTLKKKDRYPPETKEGWDRLMRDYEEGEYLDYLGDVQKREYRKTGEYKARVALAEKFAQRKS